MCDTGASAPDDSTPSLLSDQPTTRLPPSPPPAKITKASWDTLRYLTTVLCASTRLPSARNRLIQERRQTGFLSEGRPYASASTYPRITLRPLYIHMNMQVHTRRHQVEV